jgi:hypothetical protein
MVDPEPDYAASRLRLEAALSDPALSDPALRTAAHYLLWEVCQACGDPTAALDHLHQAIRRDPLQTREVPGAVPVRSVLALATPGDFQANLPLSLLLDGSTRLHTLWITGAETAPPPCLPPIDAVFVAIGEDCRHAAALRAADALARAIGRPTINSGARIASLSRDGVCRLLDGMPDMVVPAQRPTGRADLLAHRPACPFIIRPHASHAGLGLALIDEAASLDDYLDDSCDQAVFYVAPFVDYRSSDGYFRKYRIVFVDRVPYPVHLAIHDDWAIWYYNAQMQRSAWKRDEEADFLADMARALGPRALRALHALGQRIDLDYVGLDCAVLPDGRLLVFEVETGMLVHDSDPPALFAYKKPAIARIIAAVNTLLDQACL